MPVESWTRPDDVPAQAAQAMAEIDAVLGRLEAAEREAFWASIRKCYNTPYNDPAPRRLVRLEGAKPPETSSAPTRLDRDDEAPPADFASLAAMPSSPAFSTKHHPG